MFCVLRIAGAIGVVVFIGLTSLLQSEAAEGSASRLTLEQALDQALVRNPVLQSRKAEVEQAEARLRTAQTYPFNPTLAVEAARRSNGSSTSDREIRIGQEIEIRGQRRRRSDAARAELEAARNGFQRTKRQLAAEVRIAFAGAIRARELRAVEQANTELARSLAEVARKRLDSGATAQMEVNLAQAQVGRAERDRALADGAYDTARSLLAEAIGIDPTQAPEIEGRLELPSGPAPTLTQRLSSAMNHRADLQAFLNGVDAARTRVDLARRASTPNLELAAFYGREDGSDRLLGGAIQVELPIFNRNRGAVAEARAVQRRVESELELANVRIRQEVSGSLSRYRAALEAGRRLERQVLGTLNENLRLLRRSFEAGKTSWTELLVFRREFVDVRRDYIDTVTEATLAAIELDLASGTTQAVSMEAPQ